MQFQHGNTPILIKRLIQIIIIFSLLCVAFRLQPLFALSADTFYPWQLLTSLIFIPSEIFSFSYLIDIAFCMLVLWLLGSILYDRIGPKKFLIGYICSGILSGLVALSLANFGYYSEALFALLAIVTMWAMSDPYQQLYFLFVLPLKAQWILIFALLGTIVANGLQGDYASCLAYFTSFVFSYIYSLTLNFRSPFDWMLPIDRAFKKLQSFWQWRVVGKIRKQREAFMDRTLEKISRSGKESLNPYERFRLWWIAHT